MQVEKLLSIHLNWIWKNKYFVMDNKLFIYLYIVPKVNILYKLMGWLFYKLLFF